MDTNPYSPPSAALTDPSSSENNSGASTEKARGGCLTAFLAFGLIANTLTAVIYANALIKGSLFNQSLPGWAVALLLFACTVNVAACAAVWKWRRWGVYALLATATLALLVNLSLGLSVTTVLPGLLGPVILLVLVRPVWKFMR